MGEFTSSRFASRTAFATAALGVAAFSLAIVAVPPTGDFCTSNCISYPYTDAFSRFPIDFAWQPPAIFFVFGFLALMACIHYFAPEQRRIVSLIGLCVAVVAAASLAIDYYLQFAIVPVSLKDGETNGLPLLIQYNSHGIFIALEELGYMTMSLSFALMSAAIVGTGRLVVAVRWVFRVPIVVTVAAMTALSFAYGLERHDRFELWILSACWFGLIANGIMLGIVYRRAARAEVAAAIKATAS